MPLAAPSTHKYPRSVSARPFVRVLACLCVACVSPVCVCPCACLSVRVCARAGRLWAWRCLVCASLCAFFLPLWVRVSVCVECKWLLKRDAQTCCFPCRKTCVPVCVGFRLGFLGSSLAACVSVLVVVCLCRLRTYTHIHIHTHTYTYPCMCIHMHTYAYICIHIHTYTHTYI